MEFFKYSSTGNDFIVIDDRQDQLSLNQWSQKAIEWCHRKNGVGADGIILLKKSPTHVYQMVIINSDGTQAEMCGNGLRAISHFAHFHLKLNLSYPYEIATLAGPYTIYDVKNDLVKVGMKVMQDAGKYHLSDLSQRHYFIDTGVPHLVIESHALEKIDVNKVGRVFRYDPIFPKGSNVNFISTTLPYCLRTYERGVEAETDSCGTGVTAAFLTLINWGIVSNEADIQTRGGVAHLKLEHGVVLYQAPVKCVFHGVI
jgi:diaminopimelate epimerase